MKAMISRNDIEEWLYSPDDRATPEQMRVIEELMDWLPIEEHAYRNYKVRLIDANHSEASKIINELLEIKDVVLNPRFGGGGLSPEGFKKYMKDNLGITFK